MSIGRLIFGSTRKKLLVSFFICIFILFIPLIVVFVLINNVVSDQLPALGENNDVQHINHDMMADVQSFIEEDSRTPEFLVNGSAPSIQRFEADYGKAMAIIARIDHDPSDDGLQHAELIGGLAAYRETFGNVVDARRRLGYGEYGLESEVTAARLAFWFNLTIPQRIAFRNAEIAYLRMPNNSTRQALLDEVGVVEREYGAAVVADYRKTLLEYIEVERSINDDGGLHEQVMMRAERVNGVLQARTGVITERIQSAFREAIIISLVIALLSSLLSLMFVVYISRSLSRPVEDLTVAVKRLERGDYSSTVDIQTSDELEHLGESFNSMVQRMKEIDHAKTMFISISSHELRSPMTPIKAQLQMMLEGYFGKLNAQQRESLVIVLRNAERLDDIIQDLLEVSRIEASRLTLRFVKTDLHEHIRLLLKEMEAFLPEKRVKIVNRIGVLPIIECDPDRIMQVLRNLLNNAVKFSYDRGEVVIDAQVEKDKIIFSVSDNGIGISPEAQQKLFNPFYQEENTFSRKYGGTGLGLAICKGIVERLGGKIWLASEKGKGTAISFSVPLSAPARLQDVQILANTEDVRK